MEMIVLKATQDKVLAVLQSVAGIVERRHVLPILANVLMRKADGGALFGIELYGPYDTSSCAAPFFHLVPGIRYASGGRSSTLLSSGGCSFRNKALTAGLKLSGFFSASKANLRNAP